MPLIAASITKTSGGDDLYVPVASDGKVVVPDDLYVGGAAYIGNASAQEPSVAIALSTSTAAVRFNDAPASGNTLYLTNSSAVNSGIAIQDSVITTDRPLIPITAASVRDQTFSSVTNPVGTVGFVSMVGLPAGMYWAIGNIVPADPAADPVTFSASSVILWDGVRAYGGSVGLTAPSDQATITGNTTDPVNSGYITYYLVATGSYTPRIRVFPIQTFAAP